MTKETIFLRIFRELGLGYEELASQMGLKRAYVHQIVTGKKGITPGFLRKIHDLDDTDNEKYGILKNLAHVLGERLQEEVDGPTLLILLIAFNKVGLDDIIGSLSHLSEEIIKKKAKLQTELKNKEAFKSSVLETKALELKILKIDKAFDLTKAHNEELNYEDILELNKVILDRKDSIIEKISNNFLYIDDFLFEKEGWKHFKSNILDLVNEEYGSLDELVIDYLLEAEFIEMEDQIEKSVLTIIVDELKQLLEDNDGFADEKFTHEMIENSDISAQIRLATKISRERRGKSW